MTSGIPREVIIKIVHQLLTASALISEAAAMLQSMLLLPENQTRETSMAAPPASSSSSDDAVRFVSTLAKAVTNTVSSLGEMEGQLTQCANQFSRSTPQPGGVRFIREGPSSERPDPGPSSAGSSRETEPSLPSPSVIPPPPPAQSASNIGAVRTSTERSIKTRGPYTTAACIACRRAKRKCISLSPGNEDCAQCIMRDQPCVYPAAPESVAGASVDTGEGSPSSTLNLNITPIGDPAPQSSNTKSAAK